jgi:hypothetical protein
MKNSSNNNNNNNNESDVQRAASVPSGFCFYLKLHRGISVQRLRKFTKELLRLTKNSLK